MIRILVLARDQATCDGLAAALSAAEDMESGGTARTADEVRSALKRPGPRVDAVVAAAELPGDDALVLAREFRGREDAPWLVVTGLPPAHATLVQYVEAGADAYLTDDLSISGLLLTLRLLRRGETLLSPPTARRLIRRLHALADLLDSSGVDVSAMARLTPREREVLDLVGHGLTNKEIGRRLFIEVGTVKTHVHAILSKLEVRDREEARSVLILARTDAAGESATTTGAE